MVTALIVKAARTETSAFSRFAAMCDKIVSVFAEAQALARAAQQRYPFTIE